MEINHPASLGYPHDYGNLHMCAVMLFILSSPSNFWEVFRRFNPNPSEKMHSSLRPKRKWASASRSIRIETKMKRVADSAWIVCWHSLCFSWGHPPDLSRLEAKSDPPAMTKTSPWVPCCHTSHQPGSSPSVALGCMVCMVFQNHQKDHWNIFKHFETYWNPIGIMGCLAV